jgi:hypothetical protein
MARNTRSIQLGIRLRDQRYGGRVRVDRLTEDEFKKWWSRTGEYELRQVMLWVWDPIGVQTSFPNAADEYDSYAQNVVEVLRSGRSEDELVRVLLDIERGAMRGCGADPERLPEVARRLAGWYARSTHRWVRHGALPR